MPRLFFAGCIDDTRPSVRYLMREEKERFREGLQAVKAKPLPSKQSGKFKCQIWFKITKKIAIKCLDAPSLQLSRKISA